VDSRIEIRTFLKSLRNLSGASDNVPDSLSRALRLNETERTHQYDRARAASGTPPRTRRRSVRPTVRRMLGAMAALPALVLNNRFDVLATNPLGRALYSPMFAGPACKANTARFVFFSPGARQFYVDWERMARGTVGALCVEAGRDPRDRELRNLIGELSTRSDAVRVLRAAQDTHVFQGGTKRFKLRTPWRRWRPGTPLPRWTPGADQARQQSWEALPVPGPAVSPSHGEWALD
jgi:hypothetical protein